MREGLLLERWTDNNVNKRVKRYPEMRKGFWATLSCYCLCAKNVSFFCQDTHTHTTQQLKKPHKFNTLWWHRELGTQFFLQLSLIRKTLHLPIQALQWIHHSKFFSSSATFWQHFYFTLLCALSCRVYPSNMNLFPTPTLSHLHPHPLLF